MDPFTVCGSCKPLVMFPKPFDRIARCPVCREDVELPGVDTHTAEYFVDCGQKPMAAEVQ